MATLQKLITKRLLSDREHNFCSNTLDYLSTKSGKHIDLEGWMITSFEVEFGPEIGSGGLCVRVLYAWQET
jgi:hypothetical protein